MADVGTRKLFENDKVVVWEMILQPGESTGVHTHKRDYVVHILEGAKLDVCDAKGNVLFSRNFDAGLTVAPKLVGNELVDGDFKVPAAHNARNVDTKRFREILIETK